MTYSVNGRQYVAFSTSATTGGLTWASRVPGALLPDLPAAPPGNGLYVFALPSSRSHLTINDWSIFRFARAAGTCRRSPSWARALFLQIVKSSNRQIVEFHSQNVASALNGDAVPPGT